MTNGMSPKSSCSVPTLNNNLLRINISFFIMYIHGESSKTSEAYKFSNPSPPVVISNIGPSTFSKIFPFSSILCNLNFMSYMFFFIYCFTILYKWVSI